MLGLFFFSSRRRHTRWTGDWSSDVCSSDLAVAVKVQYPGVAAAVRADLQNLGLLLRLAKRMAPGLDPKAMAGEIRERIVDECDYELEAQAHRAFERDWRGHPFVYVPPVV